MNSDQMPSPELSNQISQNSAETSTEATSPVPADEVQTAPPIARSQATPEPDPQSESDPDPDADKDLALNRNQPIPPPSEPMQYRAIGLVRGRYVASAEQFTQGSLNTPDGVELSAVLLGRIMSLVKNHLDLEKDHLWVVYPRTRQENDQLHLQIVGVWEPENLAKPDAEGEQTETTVQEAAENPELVPSAEVPDGGFSVRGEIVYQAYDSDSLVIKIKQAPRKPTDKPKYFKLKLKGKLEGKAVGKFWDIQAQREEGGLIIEKAEFIADLPKKRRPPFKGGGGGGRRFSRGGPGGPGGPGGSGAPRKPYRRPPGGETPRPVKKGDMSSGAPTPRPTPKPTPKPVKRPKPEE